MYITAFKTGQILRAYALSGLSRLSYGKNRWVTGGHVSADVRVCVDDIALVLRAYETSSPIHSAYTQTLTSSPIHSAYRQILFKGRVMVVDYYDIRHVFQPIVIE